MSGLTNTTDLIMSRLLLYLLPETKHKASSLLESFQPVEKFWSRTCWPCSGAWLAPSLWREMTKHGLKDCWMNQVKSEASFWHVGPLFQPTFNKG